MAAGVSAHEARTRPTTPAVTYPAVTTPAVTAPAETGARDVAL
jgi:hypothetical protein